MMRVQTAFSRGLFATLFWAYMTLVWSLPKYAANAGRVRPPRRAAVMATARASVTARWRSALRTASRVVPKDCAAVAIAIEQTPSGPTSATSPLACSAALIWVASAIARVRSWSAFIWSSVRSTADWFALATRAANAAACFAVRSLSGAAPSAGGSCWSSTSRSRRCCLEWPSLLPPLLKVVVVGLGRVGLGGDRCQFSGTVDVVAVALLAAATRPRGGMALVALVAGPGLVFARVAGFAESVTQPFEESGKPVVVPVLQRSRGDGEAGVVAAACQHRQVVHHVWVRGPALGDAGSSHVPQVLLVDPHRDQVEPRPQFGAHLAGAGGRIPGPRHLRELAQFFLISGWFDRGLLQLLHRRTDRRPGFGERAHH